MSILKFQTTAGKHITLNAREESTVLMQEHNLAYSFDYSGRLLGAFRDGRNYRRSIANQILEKQSGTRGGLSGRVRRMLSQDEVRALEVEAYDFARRVSDELHHLPLGTDADAVDGARNALARINSYCYTSLERERQVYDQIYHPVTIMPPDQYLALYLQMTDGCAFNQCSFCNFYRDRRFHIKPVEVFHEHIRRVRAFLGDGMRLRHTLFLGDANALMLPQKMLLPRFDVIHQEFAIMPRELTGVARQAWRAQNPIHFTGIYSFIDAFRARRKRAAEFAALAERGLRRVYVGLESGNAELLQFLGKPNTPEDVARLVQEAKAGGVAVGIMILVGAGGAKFERAHIQDTTRLINALPLDEGDLIYFSELIDFPQSSYSELAAEAGIAPLDADALDEQMRVLRAGLQFDDAAHAPHVSLYDIREFVY